MLRRGTQLASSIRGLPTAGRGSTPRLGFRRITVNTVEIIKGLDELEYQVGDSGRDPATGNDVQVKDWSQVNLYLLSPICSRPLTPEI